MLKIAVCDDEVSQLAETISLLDEYASSALWEVEYTAFESAIDLLSAIQSGSVYQIILLDIMMPLLNGMEAAKEIREYDTEVRIVFMTSSQDFAVESYVVGAYFYALKPVEKGQLFWLLDKVRREFMSNSEKSIIVKCKTMITRIVFSKLEFVEVMNRTIFYHLTDGSVLESNGTFTVLEAELLTFPQFAKTHRSYLVNLDYIDQLRKKELVMHSGTLVPIAKSSYTALKSEYLNYSCGCDV